MMINQIVAVGSVDGILTTAALLRMLGRDSWGFFNPTFIDGINLQFCQAFTVDKIDVSAWQPGRKVAFIDLAVNNRDPQMTRDFVVRIREGGHQIVAICDEHSRIDWLNTIGVDDFGGLEIKPESQAEGIFKSSGAVLKNWMGASDTLNNRQYDGTGYLSDDHLVDLMDAADAGDRMDFSNHFGGVVNQAVKSAIADDSRRVYLARHFAEHKKPDEKITGWMKEYEKILLNHHQMMIDKEDLGNGIFRASTVGMVVDMTTLMKSFYGEGIRVVILEGEMYDKAAGCKTRQISFGSEKLDILSAIKAVVPSASGFAQKANVAPEHEAAALAAVRALLAN